MPHHPAHDTPPLKGNGAGAVDNALPLAPGQSLLFFGDSITAEPSGYVAVLAQALAHTRADLGLRLINAGISGNTVRDLEARLDRDVLAQHPTYVAICIGANDYLGAAAGDPHGVPLQEFISRYHGLLDRLRAGGVQTVLLTIPISGQDDEDHPIPDPGPYNAAILALAARERLPAVDLQRAFHEVYERAGNYKQIVRLSDDGIHPNRQGHALIARALVAQLGLLRKEPRQ